MKQSRPLAVALPASGVLFAESIHASDFEMAPRADPFHKLIYVLQGALSYTEGRHAPVPVSAGTLLAIPANTVHALGDRRASTVFLLCLADPFLASAPELAALWSRCGRPSERRISLSRPTRNVVEAAWRRALLERIRPRLGSETVIRALAAQLLVTLARLPPPSPTLEPLARVAAVAREVEATFYDEWNLDRAAARAGVSRRHFSALFKQARGCTFWEHLTELRLAHAAELLKQGEHSVTGVVFACGFGDVSQFYRLFRRRHRQPPKRWALGVS